MMDLKNQNHEDLYTFFHGLPVEVLWDFRNVYLTDGKKLEEADEISDALVPLFSDYDWMHKRLRRLKAPHHQAILGLLHTGGVVGGSWFLQELSLAHGESEDFWADVIADLGRAMLVFGNSRQNPPLFYVLSKPLAEQVARHYTKKLKLPVSKHRVRRSRDANYNHPVGMSLVAFVTYVRQHRLRVTQRGEIFKKQRDEIERFFTNLWGARNTAKVLAWQTDLLLDMGIFRVRDSILDVDDRNFQEWTAMGPKGRRDLYMAVFRRTEPLVEHLLAALAQAPADRWVSVGPLRMVYRRWHMGQIFYRRHVQKSFYLPPSGYHDAEPPLEFLSLAGLIELGLDENGRVLRLTRVGREFATGKSLGEAPDHAAQFFLQPNFDALAAASMPLEKLAKLGELSNLVACDRMSTYNLSRESVRAALERGWRAEDIVEFLREGAAHGLPQNIEGTLGEWIGTSGEVEFHDALVITVRASRRAAFLKAFRQERIAYRELGGGVFAVAREDRDRVRTALESCGFDVGPSVRRYDAEHDPARRRGQLARMLLMDQDSEAPCYGGYVDVSPRTLVPLATDLPRTGRSVAAAQDLSRKPGSAGDGDFLRLSPGKVVDLVRAAINRSYEVEMLYNALEDGDPEGLVRVCPLAVQSYGAAPTFTARIANSSDERKFAVRRIRGIRVIR
jgi:hypothetical protein